MKKFIQADIIFYIFLIIVGIGGISFSIMHPETEGFYASMIAAALAGLGVTIYIFYAKHYRKHLACPSGSDCNSVVNSKYSHFAGIPLEYLGSCYYAAVVTAYILLISLPYLRESLLLTTILILTATAFIFSIYLVIVQAFILKKWCIWCLLSAALSTVIFIASLVSIESANTLLGQMSNLLEFVNDVGFVLGAGGSTAAIFMFFRFLDDFKINDNEARALKGLSEMVWIGVGLIIISRFAMYVSQAEILSSSSTFLAGMISIFVVFVSGAVINVLLAPFISVLPFHHQGDESTKRHGSLESLKKATFITGSIALSSWYFALTLNYLPEYDLIHLLLAYVLVLIVSIGTSLVLNKKLS